MEPSVEITYLGLFVRDGLIQTVRVKRETVFRDESGNVLARQEGDESAIPDGDPIEGLVGEALVSALKTNKAVSDALTAERARRAEEQAAASAEIQRLQGEIDRRDAAIEKRDSTIERLNVQLATVPQA